MTKGTKKRSGRAPSAQESIDMHALGYGTIVEVAKLRGVAPTTVYGWATAWYDVNQVVGGKPAVIKSPRGVWVLKAAAVQLKPTAKELTRKPAA